MMSREGTVYIADVWIPFWYMYWFRTVSGFMAVLLRAFMDILE